MAAVKHRQCHQPSPPRLLAQGLPLRSPQNLLANSASSGKVFKVNTILVSNVDGSNSADATIMYYNDGSNTRSIYCTTVAVPADSTLVALDKNSVIYLEENTSHQ